MAAPLWPVKPLKQSLLEPAWPALMARKCAELRGRSVLWKVFGDAISSVPDSAAVVMMLRRLLRMASLAGWSQSLKEREKSLGFGRLKVRVRALIGQPA